jgi:hypothetical protein
MFLLDPIAIFDSVRILYADVLVIEEFDEKLVEDIAGSDPVYIIISENHNFFLRFHRLDDLLD